MRPQHVVQTVLDPNTGGRLPLVGLLSPGEGCVGFALTANEAQELGQLLIECAADLRAAEETS
jgi:hypothetical protein